MDDLGSMIGQIMKDPEQLHSLMEMAKSIFPQGTSDEDGAATQEHMNEIGKLLQSKDGVQQKQEALMRALQPYLRPGRRSKLDRAIQIAKLSHIAGIALKNDLIP